MESVITKKQEKVVPSFKKNYPVFRFLGGNLISFLGDQIYLVAIPLMVLAITGSPLSMGLVSAMERLPNLLQPFAGPIADRLNRKAIMIVCDLGRCFLVGSLGLLFIFNNIQMWHLYIGALLIGLLSQLYNTVQFTCIPTLVQKDDLHFANSIESSSINTAILLGPTLGSLIISFYNPGYALIINSISFFIAFIAILSIKFPETPPRKPSPNVIKAFFADLKEGFEYVIKIKIILYTNIALLISTFGTTLFLTIMVFHMKDTLEMDVKSIGILLSIGGLGAIGGSLVTNLLLKKFTYKRIFSFSFLVGGISVILFGVSESYILLVVANLLGIVAASAINPCIKTIRQTYTPDELLGRVQATSRFITWALLPFAAFLSGFLSDLFGTSAVIILGGVIGMCAFFVFLHPKVAKINI